MKFYAVIPVYNVAEYITEFLESLIMQDDTDISYILINDGSTDNSGSICDEYAQRDNRLIVKHTANQGVSKARNTGLEIVLKEGNDNDYVLFFDPDDYLTSPQAVSLIRRNLSQLPDILTYNHLSNNKPASQNIKTGGNFEGKEIGQKLFPSYLCGKLINGDRINSGLFQSAFSLGVIRRNNIRFREDIRKAEDTLFYAQFLTYVNRAVLANITPYNYRIRSNSLTTTYRKPSEIGARKGISGGGRLRRDGPGGGACSGHTAAAAGPGPGGPPGGAGRRAGPGPQAALSGRPGAGVRLRVRGAGGAVHRGGRGAHGGGYHEKLEQHRAKLRGFARCCRLKVRLLSTADVFAVYNGFWGR